MSEFRDECQRRGLVRIETAAKIVHVTPDVLIANVRDTAFIETVTWHDHTYTVLRRTDMERLHDRMWPTCNRPECDRRTGVAR